MDCLHQSKSNQDRKLHNQFEEEYREKYIRNTLQCKFIRCNPDDPGFNIFDFLFSLRMLLNSK